MDEQEEFRRFQMELEFVQCLCNLGYLHCIPHTDLATMGYFDKEPFIKYLEHLLYWKKKEYVKFLMYVAHSYPQTLHFLDMLQKPEFRQLCKQREFIDYVHRCQWQHWVDRARPGEMLELQKKTLEDMKTQSEEKPNLGA